MIPEKQKAYKKAYTIACEELLAADISRNCRSAGVVFLDNLIFVPFFDEELTISWPDLRFVSSKTRNVNLVTKVLVVHYLNKASGLPLSGERVAYEDIPGLRSYLPVFQKRVLKPLTNAFGFDRYAFLTASLALGGVSESYGDASVTIPALTRVPITFVLWSGDEEFQPSVRALYDSTIMEYLPREDVAVISRLAATRILAEARKLFAGDDHE